MAIKSELGKGLIYAGDTPLASTIVIEQTGPMQLTVRAGAFTTTGQAKILAGHRDADTWIARGKAERLPDGRVRRWLERPDGTLFDTARTYTLSTDRVFSVSTQPTPIIYTIELGVLLGCVDVIMRSRPRGGSFLASSSDWVKIHTLVFEFEVLPVTTDLATVPIYVLRVLPGFPEGTGPDDFVIQRG